jgi:hypothetical protein
MISLENFVKCSVGVSMSQIRIKRYNNTTWMYFDAFEVEDPAFK